MQEKNGVNSSGAHITILGGGVAGLSAGYYAKKKSLPFTVYESRNQAGGLCATYRHGDFSFDCGAHRFHDKDPDVILVALFLDKEYVTKSATVYFPSPECPFTRVYEPGNRNAGMSPRGKTSLVAEIPCDKDSRFWKMDDEQLEKIVMDEMREIGWVRREDLLGSRVVKVPFAYPIIEKDTQNYLDGIQSYLKQFTNLKISGRSGLFRYSWIHNMIRFGKEMV